MELLGVYTHCLKTSSLLCLCRRFLLQCLTKTSSPYKNTTDSCVHLLCAGPYHWLLDCFQTAWSSGAWWEDRDAETRSISMLPLSIWYHPNMFFMVFVLSGIFQRLSACWCQQTSVINSLHVLRSWIPWLGSWLRPLQRISRVAEPPRPIISGLQHRLSVTNISAVQGSTCTLLLRGEKNLP